MDVATLEKRYLKIMKRYSIMSGIWPGQNEIVKYTIRFLVLVITIPAIIVQVARLVHLKTTESMIEQIPFLLSSCLLLLKLGNYTLNPMKLKLLINCIYEDWAVDRSKEEQAIMSTYAERAVFFTNFYIANAYVCASLFIQLPWTMKILNWLNHENTTTSVYIMPGYYFTDNDEKYYNYEQIHMMFFIVIITIGYIACDTGYMTFVHHACGLLSVAGYRFKYAIEVNHLEKNATEFYSKVKLSIKAHQRALWYLNEIEKAHLLYLFTCIGWVVFCFSITLVKVVTMDVSLDFYRYVVFFMVQLMHLFYLTVQGQFVINCNDQFYDSMYAALWYNADTKTQGLYALALRRMLTPPRLTAGGFVDLNMETFLEVIKICFSYYTVIHSA